MTPLLRTEIPGRPVRRGKVRDVYDFGDFLLLVATDRISAFDWVLPSGIPDKGRVLTQISDFWFRRLQVQHHLISTNVSDLPLPADVDRESLAGRSMIVRKTQVAPIECVVRGYLSGSGWKEYQQSGEVCGVKLPPGLKESDRLPEPIFTPAIKAETGHDENVSFATTCNIVGLEVATRLRDLSLDLYAQGAAYALEKGIIIADTKFEFGRVEGEMILIDEVLTPDSSRFWPQNAYEPGRPQASYDKQFVRDWLETQPWDKNSPPPELPDDVIRRTREKYVEAYEVLTGQEFAWK
ncbi:Phosphoribosylaminoimidazole-succinocarboxamide synthase [Caulifigura coniformis]|uniref:Phosphoribosylaminoimidazole-succinocarboxamide synthase n=1 Tax=Caulifigura coniformis TaxID=2527983 RepID=A0A517SAR8_9PLAN|nr:phosphoribosylaminoimidazolesuccinocarboxamide synthase [Caulifigura coniformis]QDT53212.1 Phosphoribosylaminoimidazole-succinocarboxamide synthase [Caulifigura coniformis]